MAVLSRRLQANDLGPAIVDTDFDKAIRDFRDFARVLFQALHGGNERAAKAAHRRNGSHRKTLTTLAD